MNGPEAWRPPGLIIAGPHKGLLGHPRSKPQ